MRHVFISDEIQRFVHNFPHAKSLYRKCPSHVEITHLRSINYLGLLASDIPALLALIVYACARLFCMTDLLAHVLKRALYCVYPVIDEPELNTHNIIPGDQHQLRHRCIQRTSNAQTASRLP